MEVYSSSVEDQLIDGLSFKLSPGASYITERKSVSYFPSGSNVYTTTSGTKVLRILINGDDWLDSTNTLRIFFDVRNTGTGPLRVLAGPYSFFRRMRILCGNQLVEDIDYYNRVHYMFDILRAKHVRENEDCEGFEDRFDSDYYKPAFQNNAGAPGDAQISSQYLLANFASTTGYVSVNAGQSKTVSFKPLSGLLNCGKLLPIRYAPITIELELVANATDPIISANDAALQINVSAAGTDSYGISGAGIGIVNPGTVNTSQSWQIENPQVKVDVVTLDNALNNEYASLLLSGKALPINYSSYVTQMQSITGQTPSVNITRALSRLKSVFATFDQTYVAAKAAASDTHIRVWKKSWNDLFHPMSKIMRWSFNYK